MEEWVSKVEVRRPVTAWKPALAKIQSILASNFGLSEINFTSDPIFLAAWWA
jgi:hypothetical protein